MRKHAYRRKGTPKEPTVFHPSWFRSADQIRGDLNFWYWYLRNTRTVSEDMRWKIVDEIGYLTHAERVLQSWSNASKHNSSFIKKYYSEA